LGILGEPCRGYERYRNSWSWSQSVHHLQQGESVTWPSIQENHHCLDKPCVHSLQASSMFFLTKRHICRRQLLTIEALIAKPT
jgi:hypothetical protein